MHQLLSRRLLGFFALALVASAIALGPGGSRAVAGDAAVSIQSFSFMPDAVSVTAGSTVSWTQMQNGVIHTVTADDGSFDSGRLSAGKVFSMTFPRAGRISYHCSIHLTMTGTVTVTATEDAGTAAPTAVPSASPSPAGGGVQGRNAGFHAGYNLIGVPSGTMLNASSVFAYDPGTNTYRDAGNSLVPGHGYWAFFNSDSLVSLPVGSTAALAVATMPNAWQLIGNPSGTQPAQVSGADAVFTFDPAAGAYASAAMLEPGQGAWVISQLGATITITPRGTAATPSSLSTPSPTTAPVAGRSPSMTPRPYPYQYP